MASKRVRRLVIGLAVILAIGIVGFTACSAIVYYNVLAPAEQQQSAPASPEETATSPSSGDVAGSEACTLSERETVGFTPSFDGGTTELRAEMPVLSGCPIVPNITTLWCRGEGYQASCALTYEPSTFNAQYVCAEERRALVCRPA